MANSKSAYLRQKALLKTLKNQDYTVATVYIGLTVGGVEPVGNGYVRVALDNTKWSAPADDGTGNAQESHYTVDVYMPAANGGAWGLCDGFVLADSLAGGNILYKDALTAPRDIQDKDQFKFLANQVIVKES